MTNEMKLPELGESVETATVLEVLVSAGDEVEREQSLIELETDKASVEVPSDRAGTIAEVHVEKGQELSPGALLVTFGEASPSEAEDAEPAEQAEQEESAEQAEPAEEPEPRKQAKKSKKATKATKAKKATKIEPEPEDEEPAEEVDEAPTEDSEADAPEPEPEPDAEEPEPEPDEPAEVRSARVPPAAPSVRRFAREIGVAIESVEPSEAGVPVSIADVKDHARRLLAGDGRDAANGRVVPESRPADERLPLGRVQRATARRMLQSWTTIPHVTLDVEVDVTDIEAVRERFQERARERGGKLTITPILVKVVARALRLHPRLNASLDLEDGSIIQRAGVNIGVAVDTRYGLLAPVLRDVEQKSILRLARELAELAEKADAEELGPDEVSGASFTISNLGGLGVATFTPIVNAPQVAILGVGRARRLPRYVGETLEPRLVMPLSLSFDHRALDGAEGARFLRFLVDALEEPLLLALEDRD